MCRGARGVAEVDWTSENFQASVNLASHNIQDKIQEEIPPKKNRNPPPKKIHHNNSCGGVEVCRGCGQEGVEAD